MVHLRRKFLLVSMDANSKTEVFGIVSVQVTVFLMFLGSRIFQGSKQMNTIPPSMQLQCTALQYECIHQLQAP